MKLMKTNEEIRNTLNQDGIILMLLSDSNCNVCLSIYPELEAMSEVYPRIQMISADPEVTKSLVGEYMVFVYPTILIFVDGKENYRFERVFSIQDIEFALSRLETLYFD